ncbi:MAG: hydrogenase 3 maturation endopeptidase HyCI [Candidatus Omnitrophica bacterium]|jgi:hydrogenase 3 maturation protease|nr:hydrogenase 3 maturation endopeptidase HyCI [Candidatus Omnitrophota bacterium]
MLEKNIFKEILKGRVIIIGVGNILRGDDALGPIFIKKLTQKSKITCFDVGVSPENYIGKIARENPDTILIIDALYLNKPCGEYAILGPSEITNSGFTTHDISPAIFLELLKIKTNANIYFLGIQPKNTSFGEGLSQEVKSTISSLFKLIMEVQYA